MSFSTEWIEGAKEESTVIIASTKVTEQQEVQLNPLTSSLSLM